MKVFRKILAFCLVFTACCASAQILSSPKDVIRFPDLHLKHHKTTGKGEFKDVAFGGANILWMVDSQYLWRWNYLTSSLKRIDLAQNKTLNLNSISRVENELLVFAEKVFYLIDIDTLKIKRVLNPSHGRQGPIFVRGSHIYWSDKASAWRFNLSERKLNRIAALAGVRKTDLVYHSPSTQNTLIARNNLIVKSRKVKQKHKQKIVYKLNTTIKDMYVDSVENVFFVSNDAVVRVNASGEVIQVIPAVEQSIQASLITDDRHMYFLPQRQVLESYGISDREKQTMLLPVTRVDKITFKSNFIATLGSGRPEVFRLQ
jgi:hypothetical protein